MARYFVKCGYKKWTIFLFISFLVLWISDFHFGHYTRERISGVSVSDSRRFASVKQNIPGKTPRDGPVKVLQVAYMRGGSSLFGQLFYQDPDAFYWFESLIGVYSELYGVMQPLYPLKLSHYSNGTARNVDEFEQQALIDSIDAMLSCNLHNLSEHILTNRFMFDTAIDHSYIKCLNSPNRDSTGTLLGRVYRDSHSACQRILSPVCSFSPDLPTHCYDELRSQYPDGLFANHKVCLSALEKKMNLCVVNIERNCNQSKIRALKALRITMKTVSRLLEELPDVKVIHYVRDPRGIVRSRIDIHMLSPQANQSALEEANLLCGKMLENVLIFWQLQAKYPNRLLQLRYEDLVTQPEVTTTRLYEFMGNQKSSFVDNWLKHSMNASQDNDATSYQRENGTATAAAWKDSLSRDLIIGISCLCGQVLEELDYPLVV